MTPFRRIFKFLASLKLAVILLLSLAAILGTATYYESKYDAKTAAHLVYGSWWFSLFLFMLGVNVLCAALIRYPWKKHQTGFVIVHLGIIVILIGSFITRIFGMEGMLSLAEGEKSAVVTIDQPMLSWQVMTAGADGPKTGPIQQVSAEFRWSPPREGHEVRIPLTPDMTAVVESYIHSAQPVDSYKASPQGAPAVHVQITAGKGAPMAEGRVMADEWLSLGDPDRRLVRMGPAVLQIRAAPDDAQLQAALAPKTPRVDTSDGVLAIDLGGRAVTIPVAEHLGRETPVEGTKYRIRIDSYMPHAVVKKNELVNASPDKVNPAVQLTVLDDKGEAEKHILFALYPEFTTTHHQQRPSHLKIGYTMDDPGQKGNGVDFVVGPDGALHERFYSSAGTSRSADAEVGATVPTGWKMPLMLTVLDYLPHAEAVHEFRAWHAARGKDAFGPAIRMRVEGADQSAPFWLGQGEVITLARNAGREVVQLRYHLKGMPLGFEVKLDKFKVGYDPGTKNAATYTSWVTVDDPARAKKLDEVVITMNEPLHYRDLTFFQASFGQSNGTQISTLQVAKDPGVPIKYGGSILLVAGIAIYAFGPKPRNKSGGKPKT
jgi:hypothetical protein